MRPFSSYKYSNNDSRRRKIRKWDTTGDHLVQDHTKTVYVGRELIATTIEDLRSCPVYCTNITWRKREGGREREREGGRGKEKEKVARRIIRTVDLTHCMSKDIQLKGVP